jgi:competence protein CoiA
MQLYALDQDGQFISARRALRQINYQCLECQQIVRLRGGPQRQHHFYHLEPTPFCRQHQKGPIHLQLQSYFLQHLPPGDCQLEYSFPSIQRIADVAWPSQKIIFEIQYSPITAEEVLARNRDYQQLGWRVVWILHNHRYNQMRLSAAELALRSSPHFFSNMDPLGSGMIYDQFDICEKGLRHKSLPPLPINIREIPQAYSSEIQLYSLFLLKQRAQTWNLSFAGDLMSLFWTSPDCDYLNQALKIEKAFYAFSQPFTWRHLPSKLWQRMASPYQILFRFLLERMCR